MTTVDTNATIGTVAEKCQVEVCQLAQQSPRAAVP